MSPLSKPESINPTLVLSNVCAVMPNPWTDSHWRYVLPSGRKGFDGGRVAPFPVTLPGCPMSCACRSLDIVAWPRGAISKTRSMWMRVWTSNSASDAEYVICPGCGELAETGVSDRDSRSGRSDSSDDSSETLIVMSRKGPGTADGRSKTDRLEVRRQREKTPNPGEFLEEMRGDEGIRANDVGGRR